MTRKAKMKEHDVGKEMKQNKSLEGVYKGQRQMKDLLTNGDFYEAILNSSNEWNGKRKPERVATEKNLI